ncbi:uncharacterized protein [Panulirus ornatus]
MAQCASELGSFFKDLVKKYLELYTSEWGASAALVFSFIGFVGKTLSGETNLSDLWLSIIDGEDKETARHIGNMYGLALMYQMDKIIEKQKQTGTAEDEAFCQSAEPDDCTHVSLTIKNILTPRRRRSPRGSESNPSQSAGHKYTEVVSSASSSLIKSQSQTTKNCLNTTTDGTSVIRRIPIVRSRWNPKCVKSKEAVVSRAPNYKSSNPTPFVTRSSPVKSTTVASNTINSLSSTTPTASDSSTKSMCTTQKTSVGIASALPSRKCTPLASSRTSTECSTPRVTRTSIRCDANLVTKTSTRHAASTVDDTAIHITSYNKPSTRQKTAMEQGASAKGKTSPVPESSIKSIKPAMHRTSTRRKKYTTAVSSTRSGRVPKRKVVLDL